MVIEAYILRQCLLHKLKTSLYQRTKNIFSTVAKLELILLGAFTVYDNLMLNYVLVFLT